MQRISVSLWFVAVVASAGGCTADGGDEGLLVLENVHPATSCMLMPSGTEAGTSHGALDLVIPGGYIFNAQVRSRITALAGQEDQRTIIATGANIDIAFPGSTFFSAADLAMLKTMGLTHFNQPLTGAVAPNEGINDIGFELIPLALTEFIAKKANITPVPPAQGQEFRLESLITFTIVGDMSGQKVSSQAFTYGVTFGNFLVLRDLGDCAALSSSSMIQTGYACNPTQDGELDCCQNGNELLCPAMAPTAAN